MRLERPHHLHLLSGRLWETIFPEEEGQGINLLVQHPDGSIRDYYLAVETFAMNTVMQSGIIHHEELKTGHLVFTSFLETSVEELNRVFDFFAENEIDELILDLRYNRGGRLDVAQHLASLITGPDTAGKIFSQSELNSKYECWNNYSNYLYLSLPNSLNLKRVCIITSNSTASASEMLINGLEPFIDVVVIGDTTYGKPVGSHGFKFCDKYINPITIETKNADGDGDFFNGINPDCFSEDDFTKAFDDVEEDSLKKALYYIENSQCLYQYSKKSEKRKFDDILLKGFRRETGVW